MYFNRATYYNPAIGRFIGRDTTSGAPNDPLSLNRYIYGQDNPLLNADPSGLRVCEDNSGSSCIAVNPTTGNPTSGSATNSSVTGIVGQVGVGATGSSNSGVSAGFVGVGVGAAAGVGVAEGVGAAIAEVAGTSSFCGPFAVGCFIVGGVFAVGACLEHVFGLCQPSSKSTISKIAEQSLSVVKQSIVSSVGKGLYNAFDNLVQRTIASCRAVLEQCLDEIGDNSVLRSAVCATVYVAILCSVASGGCTSSSTSDLNFIVTSASGTNIENIIRATTSNGINFQ